MSSRPSYMHGLDAEQAADDAVHVRVDRVDVLAVAAARTGVGDAHVDPGKVAAGTSERMTVST